MRRRRKELDDYAKCALRDCLLQRQELTNERLMERFRISRTTLWREEREVLGRPVPRGTTKHSVSNSREKLKTAEIIQLADVLRGLR